MTGERGGRRLLFASLICAHLYELIQVEVERRAGEWIDASNRIVEAGSQPSGHSWRTHKRPPRLQGLLQVIASCISCYKDCQSHLASYFDLPPGASEKVQAIIV